MKTSGMAVGFIAALCLLFASSSAFARIITIDSGWERFTFEDVGSAWDDTFEFTITTDAWLAVTDAFLSGDQFEFFINGTSVGLTSNPTSLNVQIGNDFDTAFNDSQWSSAEVMLSAGSYTVSGATVLSPFGSGGAALQLSSTSLGGDMFIPTNPVSAPSLGALLTLALGSIFLRKQLS